MKTKLRIVSVLMVLLLSTSLINFTSAQSGEKAVTFAAGAGDPRSIDPQQAVDTRDWYTLNVLFPALTTLDEVSNSVVPGIVTGWDVSEDGLVTTFHLIQNIPWVHYNADSEAVEQVMDEDGNPRVVTAHDVVYGWMRALNPETGSFAAFMLAPLVDGAVAYNGAEGSADDVAIRAVDDWTFEVTAPESVGYALGLYGLLNARPTPQWAIEEHGEFWTEPENIHTYGPFALKEWVHEESMTFVKNPFWPGSEGYSQANLDILTFRFLDDTVALREYEAGNIDVVPLVPADQLPRIKADPTLSQELNSSAGACTTVWSFHTAKPPFDNVHIRRAFTYAVDRTTLAEDVLQGADIPARWYTPPSVNFAPTLEEDADIGIEFDAETAQAELQMGLDELGIGSADELPPITMVFRNTDTDNNIAQALQVMWRDTLGMQVELSPLDPTTYWSLQAEDGGQIHTAGWCPDYNDANNYTRDVMRSDGIYNYGRWNSPEFDALVDEARLETDVEARRELYRQIEQLMVVEEAAVMPLVWRGNNALTKPHIERTFVPSGVEAFWKWDVAE
jgi:oligopeptide transport system substrate-binding protein